NVKAQSTPVYRKGDMIKGVQADAGKHIASGTSQGGGHVKILDGHNNVKVNNIPIARHDSNCMINCDANGNGGAKGKLVTEQKSVSASATPASKPSNPVAPGQHTSEKLTRLKEAKSKLEAGQLNLNALDDYINFKDSNSQLDGLIGQIQGTPGSATDYAAQATRGVLGFVKDGVMGIGEMAYEGIKAVPKLIRYQYTSTGQALGQLDGQILAENIKLGNITAGTIGQDALDIGKAIVKPVTDPWAKGQYVEAGTRAVTEIGTLGLGWIKGSKAAKAAEALKLEEAAKAAKIAEATKAAELAKAEQMADTAKSVDDGVHVRASKLTKHEKISAIREKIGGDIKNHPLRQAYEDEVVDLEMKAKHMMDSGTPKNEVAYEMWNERRELGIKYKDLTPEPLRDYIYEVNSGRYGDPLGPKFEDLVSKQLESGKSLDEAYQRIINSSFTPNNNVNALLSKFEGWLESKDVTYIDKALKYIGGL
ncbi:hypothetical protein AAKU64_004596, partial [Undibacterium sp. GrIS 1.8]